MQFQITNPNWKSPVQIKAELHATAVADWLVLNKGNRYIGVAELRNGLQDIAADLSRPVINHICSILGLQISGLDDQSA